MKKVFNRFVYYFSGGFIKERKARDMGAILILFAGTSFAFGYLVLYQGESIRYFFNLLAWPLLLGAILGLGVIRKKKEG